MNSKTIRNLNIVKGILSVALIAFIVINFHELTPSAAAFSVGGLQQGTVGDLHGWAWSDMPDGSDQNKAPSNQQGGRGLGWISMNGTDIGTDGNGYYKVTLFRDGTLTGMAWSEMGGWVDFAPSGPYPTITGTTLPTTTATIDPTCLAAATSTSCAVTGWIRFVAGEDTNTQDTGGWDGWVNMSGSNFGVTYDAKSGDVNNGKFSGYAWGGAVAGWINFNGVSITNTFPPNTCTDPASTATYGISLPCTCSYNGTSYQYTYPFTQNQTYPPQCSGTGATSAQIYSSGCSSGSTTLTWTTTGTATCSSSHSGLGGTWGSFSGSVATNNTTGVTVSGLPPNGSQHTVTITCSALSGYSPSSVTASTSVTCMPPIYCTDPSATNNGGPLPCVYPTPTPKPVYKEN